MENLKAIRCTNCLTTSLAALSLFVFVSSIASAQEYHYSGVTGATGALYWDNPGDWLENHVAGPTNDVVFNAIPYDTNWVDFEGFTGQANNLFMLDGNWKFGGFWNSSFDVHGNLTVGDVSNAETKSGYTSAYLTVDLSGSTVAPGYTPYEPGLLGTFNVYGTTYVGKSTGSSGYLTLIGSATGGTFNGNHLELGQYGNSYVTLQNAAMAYNYLDMAFGPGTVSSIVVNGPCISYANDSQGEPLTNNIQAAIPTYFSPYVCAESDIGYAGIATVTLNGGSSAELGIAYLGSSAGGSGVIDVNKSSLYAMSLDIQRGSVNLSDSTLFVHDSPYSLGYIYGEGMTTVGGIGTTSTIELQNNSKFNYASTVTILDGGSINVLSGSQMSWKDPGFYAYYKYPNPSLHISASPGNTASMLVDDSTVDFSSGGAYIGYDANYGSGATGNATLTIQNGGQFTCQSLAVSGGSVQVIGQGSNLHVEDYEANIGFQGDATSDSLTVLDGASAQFDFLLKAGDNGVVSVVQSGHTGGEVTVGGAESGASALTNPGQIQVASGGILGGNGTFNGNVWVNGGTLDPGYCPGGFTVNGSLDITSGLVVIDLGGPDPVIGYDQIKVNGDFDMTGGVIEFLPYNGWAPTGPTNFQFLLADNISIGPGVVFDDETGWNVAFNPATGSGSITPEATPEPASFLVLALPMARLIVQRRKKRAERA